MPYLVVTKRPVDAVDCGHPEAPVDGWPVSRRACAFLEEVRPLVLEGPAWDESISTADYIAFRDQVMALTESGGSVGPLPDGTVIEVERVLWDSLADVIDGAGDMTASELFAAYNAKQATS